MASPHLIVFSSALTLFFFHIPSMNRIIVSANREKMLLSHFGEDPMDIGALSRYAVEVVQKNTIIAYHLGMKERAPASELIEFNKLKSWSMDGSQYNLIIEVVQNGSKGKVETYLAANVLRPYRHLKSWIPDTGKF